jgi:hypothetical protein
MESVAPAEHAALVQSSGDKQPRNVGQIVSLSELTLGLQSGEGAFASGDWGLNFRNFGQLTLVHLF